MKRFISISLLALEFVTNVQAQTPSRDLTVTDVWARATSAATANAAVYFTVSDKGNPDTLTSANTPIATKAQLHESKTVSGIMQMRSVDSLAVDKDHPIKLSPGGYHLMLTGMKHQLKAGDTFPVTLNFTHAGAISTTVRIEQPDTRSNMPAMEGMNMGGMDR